MMIRTRIAVLMIGLFCLVSLAAAPKVFGQDPVSELTQRSESVPVYLNPLFVNQWVGLNANKSIDGRLFALDEAGGVLPRPAVEVSLVQQGKTLVRGSTGADGEFQFKNVAPGTYTFVAQSDYSFATIAIHVLPVGSGSSSSFEVYAAMVSSAKVKELIKDNWVPVASGVAKTFDKDPLGDTRAISSSAKVLLQNGDLIGQVSRPGLAISEQDLTGNVAHVFTAGESVAAAPVGRDGTFRMIGLPAGVYDLVVVGEDGMVVLGFEAVEAQPVASKQTAGAVRLVFSQETANSLNIEMGEPMDVDQGTEEVPPPNEVGMQDVPVGDPFFGGGFQAPGGFLGGGGGGFGGGGTGGGTGGGGGGGMGGGGLGGLLGIAGLAVGVAALSDDDDFNPGLATIIAP